MTSSASPFRTASAARLYEGQGLWSEALAIYQELLAKDPGSEERHSAVARVVARMAVTSAAVVIDNGPVDHSRAISEPEVGAMVGTEGPTISAVLPAASSVRAERLLLLRKLLRRVHDRRHSPHP